MDNKQLADLLMAREGNAYSPSIKEAKNGMPLKNVRFPESGKYGIYFDSMGYPTTMFGELIERKTYQNIESARKGIMKSKWFKQAQANGIDPFNPSRDQAASYMHKNIENSVKSFNKFLSKNKEGRQWGDFSDNQKAALVAMDYQLNISNGKSFPNTRKILSDHNGDLNKFADSLSNWKWAKQTPRRVEDVQDMMRGTELRAQGLNKVFKFDKHSVVDLKRSTNPMDGILTDIENLGNEDIMSKEVVSQPLQPEVHTEETPQESSSAPQEPEEWSSNTDTSFLTKEKPESTWETSSDVEDTLSNEPPTPMDEPEIWEGSTTSVLGGRDVSHTNTMQDVAKAAKELTLEGMGKDFGNKVMDNTTVGMLVQPMMLEALTNDTVDPNYDPRQDKELFEQLTNDLDSEQLEELFDGYTNNRHDFITAATSMNERNKRAKEMDEYTQNHPVLSGVNTVGTMLGEAAIYSPVSTVMAAKGVAMTGRNILNMSNATKFGIYSASELVEQGFQEVVWSKYNKEYEFDPTMFGFSILAGVGVKNMMHNTTVNQHLTKMLRNEGGFINLTKAEGKKVVDEIAKNVENEQAIALVKRLEDKRLEISKGVRNEIIERKEMLVNNIAAVKQEIKAATKGSDEMKRLKGLKQKYQRQLSSHIKKEGDIVRSLVDGTHPKLQAALDPKLSATSIAKELGIDTKLVNTPEKLRVFLGIDSPEIADDFILEGEKAYIGVANAQLKEMKTNRRLNMNETMKYAAEKLGDNFVGNKVYELANTDGAINRFLFNKGNLVSSENHLISSFYNWMAPDGMGRQGASKIRAIESQQKYSDMFGGALMNNFHSVGDELYAHIKQTNVTMGKAISTFHVDDYEDTVTDIFRRRLLLGAERFAEETEDPEVVKLANKFADKYNKLNDDIVKRMKHAGVQGVDFDGTEDFMHRQWDYKRARGVDEQQLQSAVYKGMMQYLEKTGEAVDAGLIAEEAKKFAYGIRNADITKVEEAQTNYIKMLEKFAEKSKGEAKEVIKTEADRLAFAKAQKELGDLAHRAKIDVNVKIGDTNLALSDLLENNFITTQKRYNSRMAARLASAEHGMKNIDDMEEWINDAVEAEVKRLADSGVENPRSHVDHIEQAMRSDFNSFKNGYMSGLKDMTSSKDTDFIRFVSKMNFAALMQYVGISSIAEFGGTIVEAGARTTLREFRESIIPHLKDMYLKRPHTFARAIDEELMTITGIGLEDYSFSTRGVSRGERIFKDGVMNKVEKVIDVTGRTTQGVFGPIEVISRRMTRNSLAQKWAQHFNDAGNDGIMSAFFGSKGKVTNRVLENAGLGSFDESGKFIKNDVYDKIKKAFKEHAEYNEHGNVNKLNLDKWDVDTANAFGDVLQLQSSHILVNPDATTQALWQTTTIGRIINQFRTFGINAATKVGGYTMANAASGLRHGDSAELQKAAAKIFWGTTLGMLAVTARENIKTAGDGEGFNSNLFDEGMMKAAAIGFSRSSLITNLDIFSDTIGGAFGFDPIFEKSSSIGRSKNMFNLSTSPTGQAIGGTLEGGTDMLKGDFKKGSIKLFKTSPFHRQLLLQQIFNYSQKED